MTLDRYGLTCDDEKLPLEPMADGYWTPWHLAQAAVDAGVAGLAAARERIHASFRKRDAEGKCACPYCTGNFEAVEEHAANEELERWSAEDRMTRLRAVVEKVKDAATAPPDYDPGLYKVDAKMILKIVSGSLLAREEDERQQLRVTVSQLTQELAKYRRRPLLRYERILEILADHGITETDMLKHRLEDWERELKHEAPETERQ